jgi:hypothetical protein
VLGEEFEGAGFLGWHDGLPEPARAALAAAAGAWNDEAAAEAQIRLALREAPEHLAARVGAYKFYFYKNRLSDAAPHALWCVGWSATRLGLPADWRQIGAAGYGESEPLWRFFLFSLKAYGYVMVRQGALSEGRAAVARVSELDPQDLVGAGRLLAVIDRGGVVE